MKGIRHSGIVVSDPDRSLRFYKDLLGFKEVKRMRESGEYIDKLLGIKGCEVLTIKMSADDGNLIELLHFISNKKARKEDQIDDIGISHVALMVNNLDEEYSKLSKEGVRFISSPQLSPDGYAKVAFCLDPDGVMLELVEVLKK